MNTTTTPKIFTSQQAEEAVQDHRRAAIIQLEYLIEDLTDNLKRMQNGSIHISYNPETRLAQVREEATKAQMMQRLQEHLETK